MFNVFKDHAKFRVIEDLGTRKDGLHVNIIRSIMYDTYEEANTKMDTLKPKENGILQIEKVFVW